MTILEMVRLFLSDPDTTSNWEDEDINGAIVLSVTMVEVDYYQGYTVSGDDETGISPSPDNITKTLIALQAAIILVGGEVMKSSREGIYVKDGDSTIDTTKGQDSKRLLFDNLIDRYNNLLFSISTNSNDLGKGFRIDMYG